MTGSRVAAVCVATAGAIIAAAGVWLLWGLGWALLVLGCVVFAEGWFVVEFPDRRPERPATPFGTPRG